MKKANDKVLLAIFDRFTLFGGKYKLISTSKYKKNPKFHKIISYFTIKTFAFKKSSKILNGVLKLLLMLI